MLFGDFSISSKLLLFLLILYYSINSDTITRTFLDILMPRNPPPIQESLIDNTGFTTLPWALFFNQNFTGDVGANWTPEFVNFIQTGTPTVTGRYYKLSQALVYLTVQIVPNGNTSAQEGSTYIGNFPLSFRSDGVLFSVFGNAATIPGHIVSGNNRIYVPSWNNISDKITLIGLAEI